MGHANFDEQMAALDALKGRVLDAESMALLRKMLANKSNLLVAKGARLAEENARTELVPDLISAYERFFANAEKTDPQCWAKNAISRALPQLGCRDKEVACIITSWNRCGEGGRIQPGRCGRTARTD